MPKALSIETLNRIYEEAEQADREVFAEQRSNVLLMAGDHYRRKNQRQYNDRIRSSSDLSESQKLRLTKNHIHKVVRHYVTNILTYSPGVMAAPQKDGELQDQEDAELNQSVLADAKARYKLKAKIRRWARHFVGIGEVAVKVFWDDNAGELKGYQQKLGEFGEPMVDPSTGEALPDETAPVFTGAFVWEEVFGFNLLRHTGSREMADAECWIVRKMVDKAKLERRYKEDNVKLKLLSPSQREDFVVFDSDRASYIKVQDQVLLKEYYWPVSAEYPEGYFVYATAEGILEEGPLPFGIFPLRWKGFDEFPTTCRGRSIIKVARPFQAEINRASSQVAMHQITIGDDKVLYQAGTKLQPGALLPGVRGISYAGQAPTILPGRDGGQYLPYIESQVREMYDVLMLEEESQEKNMGQMDPMAMLFKSLRQQKKFSEYAEKFEEFLIEVHELFLELAKKYYPDDMLIMAVGAKERINISEFRSTEPLSYKIKLEPRDETLETQFGKQLTYNHILQYVGPNLGKDDIGRIVRNMPFSNAEEAFSDLTLDYDSIKNDMLQMERGVMPPFGKYDNHDYALKRLSARIREGDFRFLNPRVQQLYQARIAMHEKARTDDLQATLAAKNEFIPTNGAMIATDMYVPDPRGPDKPSRRVRIPYQALDWLVKHLESQGQDLSKLEQSNQGVMAEMAAMIVNRGLPPGAGGTPPGSAFKNAPDSALGVSG